MQIQTAKNKQIWDQFVTSHPEANFLQSWDFYEFYQSLGKTVVRRLAYRDGQIIGAYAGVVEEAKRGRYLAVAGGPIADYSDQNLIAELFADLRAQGRRHHCAFVRLRPQLERSPEAFALFSKLHARLAPMYLSVEHAGILDLTKSEDEIIAGFRQALRRAIRKAQKQQVELTVSQDPAAIAEFYQVQLATARRHHFYAFGEQFLTKQFAAFAPHGEAYLYTARLNGEVLAQNFMIFYGQEASYHYGASTELGTKLSSAPLLHLRAMADARQRGITRYNFWGIVDLEDKNHRFYGVSTFKRGFGVAELKYLPAHDLVLSPWRYCLNWVVETLRRKIRKV